MEVQNHMINKQDNNYNSNQENSSNPKSSYINTIDPYTAQLLIMRSEMYIVYNYPHLVTVNHNIEEKIRDMTSENSVIYIIKSFTEEDIHKAIKYKIWSSTNYGNNKLNTEFKENKNVYLLFSTYKSNQFTGLAQMKSEVNFKQIFPLWARDNWRATFDIEWVLIKDVPFKEFKNVPCQKREKKSNGEYNFINYSSKSLSNSPDCQCLLFNEGQELIKIMSEYQNKNSILEHFEYYDKRQQNYEAFLNSNLSKVNQNQRFQQNFSNNYQKTGNNQEINQYYSNNQQQKEVTDNNY